MDETRGLTRIDREEKDDSNRGRRLPGPSPLWTHFVEDRLPLVSRDVRSHVFVQSASGSGVVTTYKESFSDAKVVFRIFVTVIRGMKNFRSVNLSVAVFHVLR